jgi:hypothetical protein
MMVAEFWVWEWVVLGMVYIYGLYFTWKKAWVEGYMAACEDVAFKRIEVSKHEFDEE